MEHDSRAVSSRQETWRGQTRNEIRQAKMPVTLPPRGLGDTYPEGLASRRCTFCPPFRKNCPHPVKTALRRREGMRGPPIGRGISRGRGGLKAADKGAE